jgi:hypothetical protein
MRHALTYIVVGLALGAPGMAGDRVSWNKVRYIGGTSDIKTTPYDWNTKLTLSANPDLITITVAPARLFQSQQTIRIKAELVLELFEGPGSWRRVAEVNGAKLPAKSPVLFGVMREPHFYLGIIYQTEDRKKAAILLESYFCGEIAYALKNITGTQIEFLD